MFVKFTTFALKKTILHILALTLIIGNAPISQAQEQEQHLQPDTIAATAGNGATDSVLSAAAIAPAPKSKVKQLIGSVIDYFGKANVPRQDGKLDVSVIGGPHYSNETKLGLGIVAEAHYGYPVVDTLAGRRLQSDVSLFGDFTTSGFVKLGIGGNHIFARDSKRVIYNCAFEYEPSRFWGIGYEAGKDAHDYMRYDRLSFLMNAGFMFRTGRYIYVGPAIDLALIRATTIKNRRMWNSLPEHTYSLGIGGQLMYDTRDNITAPVKGMYATMTVCGYPHMLGNTTHSFFKAEGSYSIYRRVWRGGIVASRIHLESTFGSTPWGLMPTFGGSHSMRGYFEGRFMDKNEADLTVELRQHVYRRSGAVVWVGAGQVFHSYGDLRWSHTLPNAGIGYRWEFKKNSNVRVDFGFGRGETGFIFSINEAF